MAGKQSAARMARLVARWRESGESRSSFARRHHVPAWTFWYWCRKLSDNPPSESGEALSATFVPLRVAADTDASIVEVVLPGGERLQVRAGAPAELVRVILTALRSPC
jgi:transposase-like protein